jgi:tetratricopeptide (TPR) repeat protein
MKPLKEADMVIITDTGSTDKTVESLRDHGAIVHETKMDPWRFDVPRRVSLNFVPADVDICVCIDLDEVLTEGWRDAIEQAWTPKTTRLRYPYIWSTLPDGTPGVTFWYDKIHKRSGYRWVKPVHEVLEFYEGKEVQTYCDGFKLFHYPDHTKSRGNYLSLLEMGCKEQPLDDRNSHYLGREYMYYHMPDKAIDELKRHLTLPNAKWEVERSASMRYIARCFQLKGDLDNAELWAMKACAEAPKEREPWVELGKIYYARQDFPSTYYAMKKAIAIAERPMTYICEPDSWGSIPFDIASIAAYQLGMNAEAINLCKAAIDLNPTDQRIQNNLVQMAAKQ